MAQSVYEDPLSVAGKLGYSIAGDLGRSAMKELELALVSKMFPKKFTDIRTLRTRQYILLYWRRGFFKTTLLREFSKTIPRQFKTKRILSATTEILCGSISIPKTPFQQPRIIPPAFAGLDFAVVTEHSAFLKHGGPIGAKLSILNDILEGDMISNTLVKLGEVQIDPTQWPELEKLSVTYEPSEATISYEPDIVMLSASHPFERRTLPLLVDSGHLDRYCIVQRQITREIARKCFREDYALDIGLQQQLKQQNEMLCKVRIKSLEAPPHDLLKPTYDELFSFAEIPDFRIKGDVLRTTAAHMVLRQFSEGNIKEVYTKQDYSMEDINFISERLSDFIEPRTSPLVAESSTVISKKKSKIEMCIEAIMECLSDGHWHSPEEIISFVETRFRELGREVGQATIYNALKRLEILGKIDRKHALYRIAGGEKIETS